MKKILFLFFVVLLFTCCKKNQGGGDAEITGQVIHHTRPVPKAAIYIKYNANEFPGADVTGYDEQLEADEKGRYRFACYKGSYYLYAIGVDQSIGKQVSGGIPVKIRAREKVNADIAVTEEH